MQKEMKEKKCFGLYLLLIILFFLNIYELYFSRNKYLINKYFLFRFMYLFYNLFISICEQKIILISDLFNYYIYIYSHKPL